MGGILGHSLPLPLLRHLHQLRLSTTMTNAGSWDTCVLGSRVYAQHPVCKGLPLPFTLKTSCWEGKEGDCLWRFYILNSSLVLRPGVASPLEVCYVWSVPLTSASSPPSPSVLGASPHHLGIKCPTGRGSRWGMQRDGRMLSYIPYVLYLIRVGLTFPKPWTPFT